MPIYLRKNAPMSIPSATTQNDLHDEDSGDFIKDPEQFRDILPQPFRMVDKFVNLLFHNAWEIIRTRENERYAEATKFRPPQYQCGVKLEDYNTTDCMASTKDGQYLIMGHSNGLSVIDSSKYGTVAEWKESASITHIHMSVLAENVSLISTLDDFGTARLFCLSDAELHLLHSFSESTQVQDKTFAKKCEASSEGDFVGIFFHNTASEDKWMEIFKLPKEAWLKDLSTKVAPKKTTVQGSQDELDTVQGTEQTAMDTDQQSTGAHSQSPAASQRGSPTPEKQTIKFSPPTIVMKIKNPHQTQGVIWSSAYQLSKTVDSSGEVLGSGIHHQLSQQHLQLRAGSFEQMNKNLLPYLPAEPMKLDMEPAFHFLPPGRILPHSTEPQSPGCPVSVCVWWTNHHQLMHFSLVKVTKDLEHKADIVWPLSSEVETSCLTNDSSLLALALRNNNVVIWDIYLGVPRRVVHLTNTTGILRLHFLDLTLAPLSESPRPYTCQPPSCLLAVCADGESFVIDASLGSQAEPKSTSLSINDSPLTYISMIEGFPQLMLSCWKNGQVFLHDVMGCQPLCEVVMPPTHSLASPWQPIITCALHGQLLFLKGEKKESVFEQDGTDPTQDEAAMFVFQLRSFPSLDKFKGQKETGSGSYTAHTLLNQRVDALLSHRLAAQVERPAKMQQRWGQLGRELDLIRQVKETREPSKYVRHIKQLLLI